MSLTRRQEILYTHTISIYKQQLGTIDPVTKAAQDVSYDETPTETGVKCYLFTTPLTFQPKPHGRTEISNLETLDVLHVPAGTDLHDGDIFQFTTADHPLVNTWWMAEGDPRERPSAGRRKGNVNKIFVKQIPTPGFV